jgi:hypothetical protein
LNPCGNKCDTIANALITTRDASKSGADVDTAYKTSQKAVVDESPVVVTNLQGLLAAHTDKVKGVDIINSPYGPQLNTVYMVKESSLRPEATRSAHRRAAARWCAGGNVP